MDILDAKDWARRRRSRRYGTRRSTRRCDPNGQTVRKIIESDRHKGGAVGKIIRSGDDHISTEFEHRLGVNMRTDIFYSLNRNKRWELIEDCIPLSGADEVWCVPKGRRAIRSHNTWALNDWQHFAKEKTYVAYYDIETLKDNFIFHHGTPEREQSRITESMNPPKHIKSPRIHLKTIMGSSTQRNVFAARARVENFEKQSYWTPKEGDNDEDYLDVDCGGYFNIEAVSTKGRPVRRIQANRPVTGFPAEYVRRYFLWYKTRRGHPWKKYPKILDGNFDGETEVANVLVDPETQLVGLKARFLRFQPLSFHRQGWYGQKSMRVGVYGVPVSEVMDRVETSMNHKKTQSRKLKKKIQQEELNVGLRDGRHEWTFGEWMERLRDRLDDDVSERSSSSDQEDDSEEDDWEDDSEDGLEEESQEDWRSFATLNPKFLDPMVSSAVICVIHPRKGQGVWGTQGQGTYYGGKCSMEQKRDRTEKRSKRFKLKLDAKKEIAGIFLR